MKTFYKQYIGASAKRLDRDTGITNLLGDMYGKKGDYLIIDKIDGIFVIDKDTFEENFILSDDGKISKIQEVGEL